MCADAGMSERTSTPKQTEVRRQASSWNQLVGSKQEDCRGKGRFEPSDKQMHNVDPALTCRQNRTGKSPETR
ncbi:nucleoporin [Pseudozyma hubeiensis SY62]|uniref:Nucleoporin n=1 Tax=Pseudozyma hubeiensis (strain SY62) TaxID=1305764 RepID=R9P1L6_PSEHS|nr:nucleoporin [Pseudozyma hubeiensis SY62]GAC95193.1 nucleoporin [Pseudozyma hubeiensis SY62]